MSRLRAGLRFARKRVVLAIVNLIAAPMPIGPIDRLRKMLLGLIGMRLGPGNFISSHLFVFDGRNISTGADSNLGSFARIWDFSAVTIGDRLLCSHGLTIVGGTHETTRPYRSLPGPVTIGDDVWIGVNVTIVGPCTIASGSIVGANAFVTGTLDRPGVYVGSPARLKRLIDPSSSSSNPNDVVQKP